MNIKQKMDWVNNNSKKTHCDECGALIGATRSGWLFRDESFCSLSCQYDYMVRQKANGVEIRGSAYTQKKGEK